MHWNVFGYALSRNDEFQGPYQSQVNIIYLKGSVWKSDFVVEVHSNLKDIDGGKGC